MRAFTTIALAAATASAVHLQQEESTHPSSQPPTMFDELDGVLFDEEGWQRGDADRDWRLTREEYDASGLEEDLGTSFDELNIFTDGDDGEETIDDYEIREAFKERLIDDQASKASAAAVSEFWAVTGDGSELSRKAFVAHRVEQGTSTAEEANAVYTAITSYAGLESDAQVNLAEFEDYFVLVAYLVAEEFLIHEEETYYGRWSGLSEKEIAAYIDEKTRAFQVGVAAWLADVDEDSETFTREEFERAAKILVHDNENALTSHSFDHLDYDSNGVLDWDELVMGGVTHADKAEYDPLRLLASEIVSWFDKDGDLQISREEYGTLATYISAFFPVNAANLEKQFCELAGGDDLISRKEVQEGLTGALADQQSEMEFYALNSVFNLVDADTTGSISEEDIESARLKAHDMIAAIDTNQDGAIGWGEPEKLADFFYTMDKDGDGTVTLRDVQDAVNYGNDLIHFFARDDSPGATHEDIDADLDSLRDHLQESNLDGDGRLSRAELFSRVVSHEVDQPSDDDASTTP